MMSLRIIQRNCLTLCRTSLGCSRFTSYCVHVIFIASKSFSPSHDRLIWAAPWLKAENRILHRINGEQKSNRNYVTVLILILYISKYLKTF